MGFDLLEKSEVYEVIVPFSNDRAFYVMNSSLPRARHRHVLTDELEDWMKNHGGDWGLRNHYVPEIMFGEFEPTPGLSLEGKVFEFKNARTACLFKLSWT